MKILELVETKEGWFPKKWETYTGKFFIHTDQPEEQKAEFLRVPLFSRDGDIWHVFRYYVKEENDV